MEYWLYVGLIFAFLPILVSGDYSTEVKAALGCMFKNDLPSPCVTDNELKVPINLVERFKTLPQLTQKHLQNGDLKELTEVEFAYLPEVFLRLIAVDRLSELDASKLATVIATHPSKVSLAVHMTSAVKTPSQRIVFLEKIRSMNTSSAIQHVLASATSEIVNTLGQNESRLSDVIQMPFLLNMPPRYLLQLNDSDARRIVFHLKVLSDVTKHRDMNLQEKRVWASISFKHSSLRKQYDWLLTGFTEEELRRVPITPDKFQPDFSIVQARAVFDNFYGNQTLNLLNFNEAASLLHKLTPTMLQKFPTNIQDYLDFRCLPSSTSIATAKQILEYVIANCIERKKLSSNTSRWGERIKYLKRWVYMLPPSVLEQYSQTTLSTNIFNEIQSEMLTNVQAFYLTKEGETMNLKEPSSVMALTDNLLSALPTTQLIESPVGTIGSEVLEHILTHLPSNNAPRMVSLLTDIINSFDADEILYSLLENKAANSYFDLMSSSSVRQISANILSKLRKLQNSHLGSNILDQLPPRTLSVLLKAAKPDGKWTWENFNNMTQPLQMLVNGINCDHVRTMHATDYITVISFYNQQREKFKKVFPKNLQYCCLQKLKEYLQLKQELHYLDVNEGITSALDPMDIEAVGGYVLLGLPSDVIETNKHKKLILAAIGKLSVAELLIATDLAKLKVIALMAVKHLFAPKFADYFELGNLVWFLSPSTLPASTTDTLKLAVESQALDRRLCLTAKERDSWATFLIQLFGVPELWSSGKLSNLGDLLLVFPEAMLQRVNEMSWIGAADTLQSKYYDTVESMPFYKVCMAALNEKEEEDLYLSALKHLIRWKLRAAERQLSTVYKASDDSRTEQNLRPPSEININSLASIETESYESNEDYYSDYYEEDFSDEYTDSETTETNNVLMEESTVKNEEYITTQLEEDITNSEIDVEEGSTVSTDEHSTQKSEDTTTTQTADSTSPSRTPSPTSPSQTLSPTSPSQTAGPTSAPHTESPTSLSHTERSTFPPQTADPKSPPQTAGPTSPSQTVRPTSLSHTESPTSPLQTTSISHTTDLTSPSQTESPTSPSQTAGPTSSSHTESPTSPSHTAGPTSPPHTESPTSLSHTERSTFQPQTADPKSPPQTASPTSPSQTVSPTSPSHTESPTSPSRTPSPTSSSQTAGPTSPPQTESPTSPSQTAGPTSSSHTESPTSPSHTESPTSPSHTESSTFPSQTADHKSPPQPAGPTSPSQTVSPTSPFHAESPTSSLQTADTTSLSHTTDLTSPSQTESSISPAQTVSPTSPSHTESPTSPLQTADITSLSQTTDLTSPSQNESPTSPSQTAIVGDTNATQGESLPSTVSSLISSSMFEPESDNRKLFNIATLDGISTTTSAYNNNEKAQSIEEEEDEDISGEIFEYSKTSIFDSDQNKRQRRSIFVNWSSVKFSCDAIKMVGEIAALSLTSEDIGNMELSDLNECREFLGRLDLPEDVIKHIWGILGEKKPIHLMGNLLQAATIIDIIHVKMNLSKPWILETIDAFSQHITDEYLTTSIINEFNLYNNINNINVETLTALRGFICQLDIENITSVWHKFHHVVVMLGRLPGCPTCLPKLAEIAVSPNGFGNIKEWQSEDVDTLGNIVAGLNDTEWLELLQSPDYLLSGLQPSAVHCLSTEKLKAIPKDMFSLMPPLTLAALNIDQLSQLSIEKQYAIQEVKDLKINMEIKSQKSILIAGYPTSSSIMHTLSFRLTFVTISVVYNLL